MARQTPQDGEAQFTPEQQLLHDSRRQFLKIATSAALATLILPHLS